MRDLTVSITMIAGVVIFSAAVQVPAATVTLRIEPTSPTTVGLGESVAYQVKCSVSQDGNQGLASIGFDIQTDTGMAQAPMIKCAAMDSFVKPDGFTNPDGFGGTLDPAAPGNLRGVGGAQNTVGKDGQGQSPSYPSGQVITGLGLPTEGNPTGEIVIATGRISVPQQEGSYTVSLTSAFAGILASGASVAPYPVDEATVAVDQGSFTITVQPGLVRNVTTGDTYTTIQDSIDAADGQANPQQVIEVTPYTYYEHISFGGKNITVRSTDPNDQDVVAATIIDGGGAGGGQSLASQGMFTLDSPTQPAAAPTVASLAIACGLAANPGQESYTLPEGVFPGISGTVAVSTDGTGQSVITLNGQPISDSILVQMTIDSNSTAGMSSSAASIGTGVSALLDEVAAGPVVTFDGTESNAATLSGLTIQNGFCDSWPAAGGIYGAGTSATISKCTIRDNTGTGIYQVNGRIDHCTISGNTATSYCGGGLSNCDGTIIGCKIIDNHTMGGGAGGGLGFCHGTIQDCLIAGNTAPNLYDSEDNLLAYGAGGGIGGDRAAAIRNCTIVGNTASLGGGLYQFSAYTLTMDNCILGDNTATGQDGGYYGHQVCLVFTSYGFHVKYDDIYHTGWAPGQYSYIWNDPVEFLRIQSSPDIQSGNKTADPAFLDPGNGNYHIGSGSECYNAGDPSYDPDPQDETDADGQLRVVGTIDMGAFECQSP